MTNKTIYPPAGRVDVMVDIETLATSDDAVICSIGACYFNRITGEVSNPFYKEINWTLQTERRIDPRTVQWWMRQNKDAQRIILFPGETRLPDALMDFIAWLPPEPVIWSNGATFDVVILEHAFADYELEIPWRHWNVRDCRTVEDIADGIFDRKDVKREGTHHNALDDALHQAVYICRMRQAVLAPHRVMRG